MIPELITIIIPCFVSLLLLLKLYEVVLSLLWAFRHGEGYSKELLEAIHKWSTIGFDSKEYYEITKRHQRRWALADLPVTRVFLRLPSPLRRLVVDFTFRLPSLILAQAVFLLFPIHPHVLAVSIALLWITLWIEVLHVTVNRITMGHVDSYFTRSVSLRLLPYPDPAYDELNPSRRRMVREFAWLFASLIFLVILGYTAIYSGLSTLYGPEKAFNGLNTGWKIPLDLLYFSIVTLATVGFGDITPCQSALVVRVAVASEILTGFLLVVFLLTSFSLTIEREKTKGYL